MKKSKEDLVLRSLFVPRQLDAELKRRAKDEKKSKSQLMREILSLGLSSKPVSAEGAQIEDGSVTEA